MPLDINGEVLTDFQVERYRRIFRNDCIRIAGMYHELNRSKKFRSTWPDGDDYAEANWKNFVEACRKLYNQGLANPHRKEEDKETLFRCLIIDARTNAAAEVANWEGDTSLQIMPGTQTFQGDKKDNAFVSDKFGDKAAPISTKQLLLSTGTRFH